MKKRIKYFFSYFKYEKKYFKNTKICVFEKRISIYILSYYIFVFYLKKKYFCREKILKK